MRMFPRGVKAALAVAWSLAAQAIAAPTHLVSESPVSVEKLRGGVYLVDFGKVSFGNLEITPPDGSGGEATVHFGEAFRDGRVDRKPPGTVRYARAKAILTGGETTRVAPPADGRNTKQPAAVLTPKEWGVVLPFRWVEIEGWSGELEPDHLVRKSGYLTAWDDDAATFQCSDSLLNDIWELCRYSIKATTFAGVYVDGDRERIPYEADAYLNQLSHYWTDADKEIARDTYDWLMRRPTWPSEWGPHMVFMAHADWLHTGDLEWLRPRYEALKQKLLLERVRDGFVRSDSKQQSWNDIVDWPEGERDGYQRKEVNTVVNAFHLAALQRMGEMAKALGHEEDAQAYDERFAGALEKFNAELYMEDKGAYRDGLGTDHAAQHASLFPLAFGLVPDGEEEKVARFVAEKGMRCSVYAAQYLLEGMFLHGQAEEALDLITADNDRSWKHMLESGTTITWEAWDQKYKPNQDWNHAWGAAPANLLPRFVLGVEPAAPGWQVIAIDPRPAGLREARGTVPTPLGPVEVQWKNEGTFGLLLSLPEGAEAEVSLPAPAGELRVLLDDQEVASRREGDRLVLKERISRSCKLLLRR